MKNLAAVLAAFLASSAVAAPAGPTRPEPDPVDSPATTSMFVQTGKSGTMTPVAGQKDTYALTLEGVSPRTVFFSDRPVRDAGAYPNDRFLAALGFEKSNPPNAALVGAGPDGSESVAVVELTEPQWDAANARLRYVARVLPRTDAKGLAAFHDRSKGGMPASFKDASLFIDDCSNHDITCTCSMPSGDDVSHVQSNMPECLSWGYCKPCNRVSCADYCESIGGTNISSCRNPSDPDTCRYRCGKNGSCASR